MRVRSASVVVPDGKNEDPFENDQLGRKYAADFLTKVLSTVEPPAVIGLNAPWGYGKTTFLRMWRQSLTNRNVQVLYFNAWSSDHLGDPVLAILSELDDNLCGDGQSKQRLKAMKKLAGRLSVTAAVTAAKVMTFGAVDLKADEVEKTIEEGISGMIDQCADAYLQDYETSKKSLVALKENLTEFAQNCENDGFPLVVLVDELDRCRPPYALKVLERIKHVFDVDGITFVVATDKSALSSVIRATYGQGFEAEAYLRRFVDMELSLPIPSYSAFCSSVAAAPEIIIRNGQSIGMLRLIDYMSPLGQMLGLSLRQTKRVLDRTQLISSVMEWGQVRSHSRDDMAIFILCLVAIDEASPSRVSDFESNPVSECQRFIDQAIAADFKPYEVLMIATLFSCVYGVDVSIAGLKTEYEEELKRNQKEHAAFSRAKRDVLKALSFQTPLSDVEDSRKVGRFLDATLTPPDEE